MVFETDLSSPLSVADTTRLPCGGWIAPLRFCFDKSQKPCHCQRPAEQLTSRSLVDDKPHRFGDAP